MKKLFALLLAGILCFTNTLSLQAATIDYDGTEVESKVSTQTICDTEVVSLHKTKKPKYTILYIHGGGYMNTVNATHWAYADALAQELNANVIVPIYQTIGLGDWKDAYRLLNILYTNIRAKTKTPIILLGDSAGGGLATGFCEYLAKQGKKQPNKLILFSPWLDISCSNKEIVNYQDRDLRLSVSQLVDYGSQWANGLDMSDYKLSPINGDVSKLKNVYLFVGTEEIFYPDVQEFYQKLKDKKRKVKLTVGEGMFHDYPLYINQLDEADKAFQEVTKFIKK